jgi:hypothetical protein
MRIYHNYETCTHSKRRERKKKKSLNTNGRSNQAQQTKTRKTKSRTKPCLSIMQIVGKPKINNKKVSIRTLLSQKKRRGDGINDEVRRYH